ncbi:hypothetical protein GCM10023210_17800 [Chryseobacterium ginsengisoli]|uniref:histidine kinase n=1 Tax=Chryseobacterium ginsengisoli TaxID=363853 RepID=A0ABP9M4I1_9FLAO
MKKNFTIAFILCSIYCICQEKDVEIEKLLTTYRSYLNSNLDSSIYYINKVKDVSIKKENKFYLAKAYYGLGYCNYQKGNIKNTEYFVNKSIPIALESKNSDVLSLAYNQLGLVNSDKGNYETALKLFLKALDIAEKNNLDKNKSYALANLGNLFETQNDTVSAIKYYQEDYNFTKEKNMIVEQFGSCSNLALMVKNRDPEQALKYFNIALSIAEKLDYKIEQFTIHVNLSHFFLNNKKYKNPDRALIHINKSKELIESIGDPSLYFYYYYNLGIYFGKKNQTSESIKNFQKAEEISKTSGISLDEKISLMQDLYKAFEKEGDYKQANFYQQNFHKLNDSIFTLKKNKDITEIITKYGVDKKNAQIQLLNQQKELQARKNKLIIISALFFIFLLAGILYFVHKRSQFQKKLRHQENINHQQEKEKLLQEQELKKMTALIEGQNSERNRIAKDLHDGVAGDLAGLKLLLANENKQLNNKNLEKIQDGLSHIFQEIREISHNLSINNIKGKKLKDLLFNLQSSYQKRKEFAFEMHIYPENAVDDLDETKIIDIYRILQELLNNISKHANANDVDLSINRHNDDINIILSDDGIGFDVSKQGVGLKNVQERLQTLSGKINIDSQKDNGTTVIIEFKV